MAEDKIAVEIEVKGSEESIKSIKDLKSSIKQLQEDSENLDLGSEEYKQAIENIDKLNQQLKKATQTEEQYAKSLEETAKAEKEAIKETQDLRKQFEVLEDELFLLAGQGKQNTKEFKDLTVQAAALNKRIDEVNSTLGGGDADRAALGYAKLNDGLRNLDFKSVKEGMFAIKTALASTGILLLVQGVTYLYEHFEELSKGSGILGEALRFIGDIISTVTDGINWLTDAIGITNTALDDMGKATVDNANKAKEALASQTAEYDRQIAVAKASGKSAVDLEIAKQQAIIDTNKALVEQTIAYVRQGGVLDEEQKKLLTGQLEAIKNAVTQQQVITLNAEKEKTDINKKANDERLAKEKSHTAELKKEQESRYNDYIKSQNDELEALKKRLADEQAAKSLDRENELSLEQSLRDAENNRKLNEAQLKVAQDQNDIEAKIALLEQQRQIELQDLTLTQEQRALINQEYANKEDALREEKIRKDREADLQSVNNSLNSAQSLTNSLQSLSDSYFYFKTKNLQKGSAEELKQAKKQFDINKGLSIASATISGIQGVINALSAQSIIPEPFGAILKGVTAVAIGASAAANIAKIASSKFDAGGGGGGSASAVASVAVPAPPTINIPSANTNSSTSFDETGKKVGGDTKTTTPTIKVESSVSVQEINDKQDRVKALETQSTF